MKDYKRLADRADLLKSLHHKILNDKFANNVTEQEILALIDTYQKIEQGRLIELPVKIGDTVYKIDSDIDHEWGKDSHRCTIKYYPRAVKIKNHADVFYFMLMREEDLMFETEKEVFEQLKRQKNSLEEMYADKEFIDEVLVELRGGE